MAGIQGMTCTEMYGVQRVNPLCLFLFGYRTFLIIVINCVCSSTLTRAVFIFISNEAILYLNIYF